MCRAGLLGGRTPSGAGPAAPVVSRTAVWYRATFLILHPGKHKTLAGEREGSLPRDTTEHGQPFSTDHDEWAGKALSRVTQVA